MKPKTALKSSVLILGMSATFTCFADQTPLQSKTLKQLKPTTQAKLSTKELSTKEKVEKAKKVKKVEALDESFLLFLAEIEEVDGELLHPVDIQATQVDKKKSKAKKDED